MGPRRQGESLARGLRSRQWSSPFVPRKAQRPKAERRVGLARLTRRAGRGQEPEQPGHRRIFPPPLPGVRGRVGGVDEEIERSQSTENRNRESDLKACGR
jgi:hypothetical protein